MFLPFVSYMVVFIIMANASTGEFLNKDNALAEEKEENEMLAF